MWRNIGKAISPYVKVLLTSFGLVGFVVCFPLSVCICLCFSSALNNACTAHTLLQHRVHRILLEYSTILDCCCAVCMYEFDGQVLNMLFKYFVTRQTSIFISRSSTFLHAHKYLITMC